MSFINQLAERIEREKEGERLQLELLEVEHSEADVESALIANGIPVPRSGVRQSDLEIHFDSIWGNSAYSEEE